MHVKPKTGYTVLREGANPSVRAELHKLMAFHLVPPLKISTTSSLLPWVPVFHQINLRRQSVCQAIGEKLYTLCYLVFLSNKPKLYSWVWALNPSLLNSIRTVTPTKLTCQQSSAVPSLSICLRSEYRILSAKPRWPTSLYLQENRKK